MPWRLPISWTARKPLLCRLPTWRAPGFPSPTRSSTAMEKSRAGPTSLLLGRSSCRRCSCRFSCGLHFFGVTGRRHHGDQRNVARGDHAHARRQRDVAKVLGIIDVELADIDLDAARNCIGATAHLDGVRDDADGAAAFDAGRLVGIAHMDRDVDADGGALAQAHEIDMQRHVTYGIEL